MAACFTRQVHTTADSMEIAVADKRKTGAITAVSLRAHSIFPLLSSDKPPLHRSRSPLHQCAYTNRRVPRGWLLTALYIATERIEMGQHSHWSSVSGHGSRVPRRLTGSQIRIQSIHDRNLHRPTHQRVHQLRHPTRDCKGCFRKANELDLSFGTCLIPIALPDPLAPSSNITMLRQTSKRQKGNTAYKHLRHQIHLPLFCDQNLVPIHFQHPDRRIMGVHIFDVQCTITSS